MSSELRHNAMVNVIVIKSKQTGRLCLQSYKNKQNLLQVTASDFLDDKRVWRHVSLHYITFIRSSIPKRTERRTIAAHCSVRTYQQSRVESSPIQSSQTHKDAAVTLWLTYNGRPGRAYSPTESRRFQSSLVRLTKTRQ
jgi:hypothetical protein